MKTIIRILNCVAFASAMIVSAHAAPPVSTHTDAQMQFLQSYEGVRAALAADDLAGAQQAATAIDTPAANQIAQASNIKAARAAFTSLSQQAVSLVKGHEGYYVAFCPMVANHEGYWVQTSQNINNPYMGKMMLRCGSIVE